MDVFVSLLEKFGLPTVFCIYLMVYQQRRQDRQLTLLMNMATVMFVLAKIWDVDVDAILKAQGADGADVDEDATQE